MQNPKVFISYSWDNEEHKQWVLQLADRLLSDGVEVKLDRYELKLGNHLTYFIENSISEVDRILVIFTPNYRLKADKRDGGVGYEYSIINTSTYKNIVNQEKVIPLLRTGTAVQSIPEFMQQYIHLNISEDEKFEENYTELLREIYKEPALRKPALGNRPKFDFVEVKTDAEAEEIYHKQTDAKILYVQEKYHEAFIIYSELAEIGDPIAQYHIGKMYQYGFGMSVNLQRAYNWFMKAANQNYDEAQFEIGLAYNNGDGIEEDKQKGLEWLEKSSEQGCLMAQFALGALLYGRDMKKAEHWLRKASIKGHNAAQYYLGIIYLHEYQNYKKAEEWLEKSAYSGLSIAQVYLARIYMNEDYGLLNYTTSLFWLDKAVEKNDAEAQFLMGLHFMQGLSVEKDLDLARELFEKSASQDYAAAKTYVGSYYSHEGNYSEAFNYFQSASEQNDPLGQYFLGELYEEGNGVSRNIDKAKEYYQLAANQGQIDAIKKLKSL